MTGQDIVLVLGAYSAFVLGAFGLLIKFVLDTRRVTQGTNRAVNDRPKNEPSLYDMVQTIEGDVRELRHESNTRHDENRRRLATLERDLKQHMREIADEGNT